MRTALLLQPPITTVDDLPTCFADRVDGEALREWLAHPAAKRRLIAVADRARLDDAVDTAFGDNSSGQSGVAVVYVAARAIVDDNDWEALGLTSAFEQSQSAADARIEEMIANGAQQLSQNALSEARTSYREAETRVANESTPRHAEILISLAEIERLDGNTAEATLLLERALSISPRHEGALRARAALARGTGEHAVAAAMLQRLSETLTDNDERGRLLETIAHESLEAARAAVLGALELRPGDIDLLHRRRTIAELSENWDDAVTVEVQLAEHLGDAKQRAKAFVRAANMAHHRAGNVQRAVALYEAAIEDDPRVAGAFAAIEQALVDAEDYAALAEAYQRQLERLGDEGEAETRADLLRKLARVSREKLEDTGATIAALDQLCVVKPDDFDARIELAELLDWIEERTLAVRTLEAAASYSPFRAEVYRELNQVFIKTRDDDRSYSACSALVTLGEADIDEQLVYSQFAPEEPLRLERPFDEEVWNLLAPDDHENDIDAIMSAIEPAAVDVWLDARERSGDAVVPDERYRQNPETTTVSAVRSFAWASRLLDVAVPTVYAQPENAKVGAATLPVRGHAVLLGRQVLTGRSPVELTFIAAHHMAYSRRGWRAITFFPKTEELEAVALSAISLVRPDLVEARSLGSLGAELTVQLDKRFDEAAKKELGDAIDRLQARGAKLQLDRWVQTVERTACRAALLAAGDVAVATPLLAVIAGAAGGMTARQRARDLIPFSASQRYAALRGLVGVRVGRG